jgi:hypothetical protein
LGVSCASWWATRAQLPAPRGWLQSKREARPFRCEALRAPSSRSEPWAHPSSLVASSALARFESKRRALLDSQNRNWVRGQSQRLAREVDLTTSLVPAIVAVRVRWVPQGTDRYFSNH